MPSHTKQAQDVRRAQRESTLMRELAKLFLQLTMDDPRLQPLTFHRVRLSPDNSTCIMYLYSSDGQAMFQSLMPILILYKPSLRKALSMSVIARHTPNLLFKYDVEFDKQRHVEDLIDKLKADGQL